MADNPPYVTAYGNISKALNKIQEAAVPPRFTQDFLATKLGLKGGSPKPVIPFLKKTGFLGSDSVPTELYKRFRNPNETGRAAAEALRKGFLSLYEIHEYIHEVSEKELRGVVVQATGLDADSTAVKSIIGSFKALKEFATFDDETNKQLDEEETEEMLSDEGEKNSQVVLTKGLGLSYTINLNLPATSDITVFDSIFKSLKENLLK